VDTRCWKRSILKAERVKKLKSPKNFAGAFQGLMALNFMLFPMNLSSTRRGSEKEEIFGNILN